MVLLIVVFFLCMLWISILWAEHDVRVLGRELRAGILPPGLLYAAHTEVKRRPQAQPEGPSAGKPGAGSAPDVSLLAAYLDRCDVTSVIAALDLLPPETARTIVEQFSDEALLSALTRAYLQRSSVSSEFPADEAPFGTIEVVLLGFRTDEAMALALACGNRLTRLRIMQADLAGSRAGS